MSPPADFRSQPAGFVSISANYNPFFQLVKIILALCKKNILLAFRKNNCYIIGMSAIKSKKKGKVGRPAISGKTVVYCRVPDAIKAKLDEMAKENNFDMSVSQICEGAIVDFVKHKKA